MTELPVVGGTPAVPQGLLESLAERVSLWALADPTNTLPPTRSGVKRDDCLVCGTAASMFVTERSFRCDSCGAEGGVVEFLMAQAGMSYRDALAQLATKAGLADHASQWETRVQDAMYALDIAAKWYAGQFAETPAVQSYWRETRGFSLEMSTHERIGFAPRQDGGFRDAMRTARVRNRALVDAGLFRLMDGGRFRTVFRDRLLFPITDDDDVHTLGFGGRLLATDAPDYVPKYLNTANSVVYEKGARLYGIGAARSAILQRRTAILVEGYFARLRVVEAGYANVVAPCGTALTIGQVEVLRRLLETDDARRVKGRIIVFFDDGALERAVVACEQLLAVGFEVDLAVVPAGADDPDTLGRTQGLDAVRTAIDGAQSAVEVLYEARRAAAAADGFTLREREACLRDVLQLVLPATARGVRLRAIKLFARWFRLTEDEVRGVLDAMATPPKHRTPKAPAAPAVTEAVES